MGGGIEVELVAVATTISLPNVDKKHAVCNKQQCLSGLGDVQMDSADSRWWGVGMVFKHCREVGSG